MKRMKNEVKVSGYLMEHKLKLRTYGPNSKNPGVEYISGSVDVATDDAKTNVVSVTFNFVSPTYSNGKDNLTFKALKQIITGEIKTAADGGNTLVRINGSIGINDFYTDRNGQEELVSAKRYEGSFLHLTNALDTDGASRNLFETDIIITNVSEKEADEEKGLPAKAIIKGAIFSYRGAMIPVEYSVTDSDGINFFMGLEATAKEPVFMKVKGTQVSETIVTKFEEKGAYGEPSVKTVTKSRKDYVVTWGSEAFVFDDESTITAAEFKQLIADRNTYLAGVKARNDEYKASKSGATTVKAAPSSSSDFSF